MDRLIPIVTNEWYHVYNRGNDRNTLFRVTADYRAFAMKMEQACAKHKVERIAYAPMPNHFHVILKQLTEGDLPRTMGALGTSYAKRYNLRYDRTGHVFQGRYRYTHIASGEALLNVARYIHLNPVRAYLVSKPEDWEFSDFKQWTEERISYAAFVRKGADDIEAVRQALFGEPG